MPRRRLRIQQLTLIIQSTLYTTIIANSHHHEQALEAARRAIPMRRFGSAEELADVVAFVAGPR